MVAMSAKRYAFFAKNDPINTDEKRAKIRERARRIRTGRGRAIKCPLQGEKAHRGT